MVNPKNTYISNIKIKQVVLMYLEIYICIIYNRKRDHEFEREKGRCSSLKGIGSNNFRGTDIVGRFGFIGVEIAFLEKLCHCGGGI